jgi:hypothetical protein
MPVRLPPLGRPALLVADGGARSHAPDHGREAFELAIRLGATALAATVWRTADDEVVVARAGTVGLRRRRLSSVATAALPDGTLRLVELLDLAGDLAVSLAIGDRPTFDLVVEVLRDRPVGPEVWCRHEQVEELAEWRRAAPDVRLLNSVRLTQLRGGPERRAADLRDAGIEGVVAPAIEWASGHVALFHRFGRVAWADDAIYEPAMGEMLVIGIDAVASPHVDRLVEVAAASNAED